MAAQRITMRKIREILRLRLAAGLSIRQISQSTKARVGAIQKLLAWAVQLELGWAPAGRPGRCRPGPPVLPSWRCLCLRRTPHAGLGNGSSGDPAFGHDPALAVGGVRGAIPQQQLQLLTVLRALPALAGPAKAVDAPDPQSRREVLYRLCRPDGSDRRSGHRRVPFGPGLCCRARGLELHLCRGHA